MMLRNKKIFGFVLIVLTILLFLSWPLPDDLYEHQESTCILDRKGRLLWLSVNGREQYLIPYEERISRYLVQSTLLYEDEFFYYHPGLNPISTFKAVLDYFKGKKLRGSSTITMQCARIYMGNKSRTLRQKLKEIFFSFRWEWQENKENILRWYFNHAPYGRNIIGIYAASLCYWGKSPHELSIAESALLAVLPNDPGRSYPGKNQENLRKKRNHLLFKMYCKGKISRQEWVLALSEPVPDKIIPFPSMAMHVYDFYRKKNRKNQKIRTTLDAELQEAVQQRLNQYLSGTMLKGIHNGAALVIDVRKGEVLAYVGNGDFRLKNPCFWVDMIQSPRSTGSTLKPFLLATAMEKKILYPSSWLSDVPEYFGTYDPSNASGTYDGVVSAREAMDRSLNVPFVELLRKTGVPVFYEKLKNIGFRGMNKSSSHYGLSLILGGAECTLWELSTGYLNLFFSASNDRKKIPEPILLRKENYALTKENAFDPGAAHATILSMSHTGTIPEISSSYTTTAVSNIYYKTGTSYGFRDAWVVGMNGKYLVGIWLGNADGEGRKELNGRTMAVPLMRGIFEILHRPHGSKPEVFPYPAGFYTNASLCAETGYELGEYCERKVLRMVPSCARPAPKCMYHQKIFTDSSGRFRYGPECLPRYFVEKKALILTPEQEMYYKLRNPFFIPVPSWHPSCLSEKQEKPFQILYPKDGLSIILPPHERLFFKAVHRNRKSFLKWYLNDTLAGTTKGIHQISLALKKGKYHLWVMDGEGNKEKIFFEIIR